MSNMLNVSSSPHLRSSHTTGREMYNVILSLLPATIFAVFHFGLYTLLVILCSIASCMATEFVFNMITRRKNSLTDCSAVVTGILLALVIPPSIPLYAPILGGVFAILVTKCFFGGLGQNFMNPALAGRAFLLISFGKVMTDYSYDTVSGATPLAQLANGETIDILDMFLGHAMGHIGVSICALLIGAVFLLVSGTITWEIPVSCIAVFLVMMGLFGGQGFDPMFLAAHFCGGGLVLGAFFMATDPVTSPMTRTGQLIYGALIGGLAALFRFYSGMADGMSYAIIISNLIVPLLDKYIIPVPWGVGTKGQVYNPDEKKKGFAVPKSAVILMAITAIAGAALAGVYAMTKTTIDANQEAKKLQAYAEVVPGGETFEYDETISAAIEGFGGAVYGDGAFGKAYINEVAVAKDASGNVVGYGISATTMDGYDGEISMAVGMDTDGKILGVSFTVLNETAGMGMLVNEESWRNQFQDKQVDSFVLLKQGGSTADNEIDSVSGASTTSGAVVNAVNAAIDFYKNYLAQ